MKRLGLGIFAMAFIASVACAASAQQIDTTPIPLPPKPDLSAMKFLVGTWSCSSKSARRATASTATVTYAMDPTGYWILETTKAPGVPWYPHASVSTDHITYDASTKRWVDTSTDDTGGYDMSVSDGWHGNTMVWHEVTYAKGADIASSSDSTQTKNSETKVSFVSSFKTTKGRVVGVSGTCTKT
jgi:hypothetical protein